MTVTKDDLLVLLDELEELLGEPGEPTSSSVRWETDAPRSAQSYWNWIARHADADVRTAAVRRYARQDLAVFAAAGSRVARALLEKLWGGGE